MSRDKLTSNDLILASVAAGHPLRDTLKATGRYDVICRDRAGNILWDETIDNLVVTVGLNQLLTNGISTASYMLLISSVSYSAIAATDTMASHSGWLEAGSTNAPTYSGTRPSITWGTPASGAVSITAVTFTMTGSGTVEGAAITNGSGASSTIGATTGTLLSAGAFSTAQPVISGNTLTVNYTLTL